ncbi:uncharacterized protein Gasu_15660 [Galdieria sulphuraria]|uniref:Uncharacterized protein n=1 Tax=Galdieria sulphuraria TaxID=130081 RepID=M2Y5C6_GALSU|nr:uncharacterized protein Gasu_15660 [Galdieria sulphuraria]EME31059.1 hypothetical protein Gasu_15660 [Galdieria sulphuraria]|eukprot:XP_005707579.1 hypothetical protein Gasu_15660 [Galdieria sulphuraria]
MPPFLIYPIFPASIMAIFKSTQSPLGWPLSSPIFSPPFPTHFPPSQFPHSLPSPQMDPFFPSPPQWQFQITITLGWPQIAPFPHPFSPWQFPHSLPFPNGPILPNTHNGNFQIKIARAHLQ